MKDQMPNDGVPIEWMTIGVTTSPETIAAAYTAYTPSALRLRSRTQTTATTWRFGINDPGTGLRSVAFRASSAAPNRLRSQIGGCANGVRRSPTPPRGARRIAGAGAGAAPPAPRREVHPPL